MGDALCQQSHAVDGGHQVTNPCSRGTPGLLHDWHALTQHGYLYDRQHAAQQGWMVQWQSPEGSL